MKEPRKGKDEPTRDTRRRNVCDPDAGRTQGCWPAGYHTQPHVRCCANCVFGGYIGSELWERVCICEVNGECADGDYATIAKDPLGLCRAFKWPQEVANE